MIFEHWSRRLGLAATPLFGPHAAREHVAMLDGVAGSFVLSDAVASSVDDVRNSDVGRSWSWSAMMRHHVLVDADNVTVTSSSGSSPDRIRRRAVEDDLEGFLAFLERKGSPSADVVDHVIGSFQGLRARVTGSDTAQLNAFLALIALRLANPTVPADDMPDLVGQLSENAQAFGLDPNGIEEATVSVDLARKFFATLLQDSRSGRELRIDLTVRHAGAELFQAAHLAPPVQPAQGELWGMSATGVRVRPHSLKEIAYTPVGLARILAEQSLQGCKIGADGYLTIMDPTCGSGSFLVEAIAALQRTGWKSKVRVVGYDISPTAIATARFAIACARRDGIDFEVDAVLEQRDFLDNEQEVAPAQVILMNPPFRSWPDMSKAEQGAVRASLGADYRGRPDKSMAFIQRAVRSAENGAIISALLPGGVLASESGRAWRESLAKLATPRMIGTFGDHSLFRFATVNACALSLVKGADANLAHDSDVQMMWASEIQGAASTALRTLRRERMTGELVSAAPASRGELSWNLYATPLQDMLLKPNWLPAPGLLKAEEREALGALRTRVNDLFTVHTGVRAGERKAFILTSAELDDLPAAERHAFRPIAEKRSIAGGAVNPTEYLFSVGEDIMTEAELKRAAPCYYERHLLPAKSALGSRARAGERWWRQSEPRNKWRTSAEPRIVSRQWIKNDGFAVDRDGAFAVVQGFAWFPTTVLKRAIKAAPDAGELVEVLGLYTVLMSSDVFFRVAREYSTNAGGGQITLQQKHVNHVPLPLIPDVIVQKPHLLDEILGWRGQFPELDRRNAFAAACYGFTIEA
ncbi:MULTISPECIES: N-6 DNA methylase [Sphingomonas]|uniref:N-6 DNA methylase n=1 Tax=Sphingomonas TaxID=13687 RepID=UPI0012ED51BE|nr:N-6 DNA methylase [Sphingomonas pituitosa]